MKKLGLVASLILAGCSSTGNKPVEPSSTLITSEGTTAQWMAAGEAAVKDRMNTVVNTKRAKNVILFIGDGMGVSTLTAGRILEGQLQGNPGEENYLSFEKFPHTALVKTYNVDAQIPDSAGTASALNTGTKTMKGVINTAPGHKRGTCKGMMDDAPTPMAEYVERAGMSTGIVSTARLTHATPAAVYAHSPDRYWEADIYLPAEAVAEGCTDIAQQILSPLGGDGLDVALGGGRSNFLPEGTGDGKRKDGKNITEEWLADYPDAKYVTTKSELASVDYSKTKHLLGLFSGSHMDYSDRKRTEQPELADMTEAAIKTLQKNKNGYYLMVEAGRIDHGHHEGNAHKALYDTVALSKAVNRALDMVDIKDTLILVTADHSHTFVIAGYADRGNPILGLSGQKGDDGKPYTTVGYMNGPGAVHTPDRPDLTDVNVEDKDFVQQSLVPLHSETHGGEDVALFAIGPWSHLVRGTMEQNVVFHIIDQALEARQRSKNKK